MISFVTGGRRERVIIGKGSQLDGARNVVFADARAALDFLRRLSGEPGHMNMLRRVFAETMSTASLNHKSDHEILEQLAWFIAARRLQVMEVTPLYPVMRGGGEPAQVKKEVGKGVTAKPLPDPIVPPEYIILARKEANSLIDRTRELVALLNQLLFMGFSRLPNISKLASEFTSLAELEAEKLDKAAFNLDAMAQGLRFNGFDPTRLLSDIAPSLPRVAEMEGNIVDAAIRGLNIDLHRLRFDGFVVGTNITNVANDDAALDDPAAKPEEAESAGADWVEIVLKDEAGEPAAGVKYRITLADGSVREGELDNEGKARVEGLPPGDHKITFPDLDAESWG